MQQLKAQDAAFLYLETPNNYTHVTGVNIYDPSTAPDGIVRFKDIIAHVESRINASPIFRRRLVRVPLELDYPYWVDDEYFDIEYHMRHGRLPEPGDWRQLCIHLARYHSRPLDMHRPPWEMFVIEGLDKIDGVPSGSYAVATKIHHVAVDGSSAMRFFSALADRDAKGTPVFDELPADAPAERAPDLGYMLGQAFINNATSPVRMANTVVRSAPALVNALQKVFRSDQDGGTGVPKTRFNKLVAPHKMWDGRRFKLAEFKPIRQAVAGATINDVVLAICSGALRQYLQFHNELPRKSLVAWVPINARSRGTSAEESPGNNITAMTAEIHTNIEDPIERLGAITRTTRDSKQAKSGVSARLMTDLSQHVPAATQAFAGRLVSRINTDRRLCNLFISNVPGPQTDLYMNGAHLVSTFGMAPLNDGMGLFIATPSYNGEMTFGVTSTREMMPDIAYFMDCLTSSFEELKKAAANLNPDSAAAKKKRARKRSA